MHEWLTNLTQIISEVFALVNWGKMYEELKNACDILELQLSNPLTWSNTKFANYAHRVYLAMNSDFPAVLEVLDKIIKEKNKDAKAREKADNVGKIKRRISNKKFAVRLCGVTDIYKVFGQIVGVLQSVNSLPFQRYDQFQTLLKVLEEMCSGESVSDHSKCQTDKCLWPKLHSKMSFIVDGSWDGNIKLQSNHEGSMMNYTRQAKVIEAENARTDPVSKGCSDLTLVCKDFLKLFKEKVYDTADIAVVEHTRKLTDLTSLSMKIRCRSSTLISLLEGPTYLKSCLALVRSLGIVEKEVILIQFDTFVKKLAEVTKDLSDAELKKVYSKDLIIQFLSSKKKLFCGVELIMQAIAVASIKISVESIAESFISEYNRRNDKLRTLTDDAANFEMEISKNGPLVAECDAVVKEGLDSYFNTKTRSKKWNFITRSGAVDGKLL